MRVGANTDNVISVKVLLTAGSEKEPSLDLVTMVLGLPRSAFMRDSLRIFTIKVKLHCDASCINKIKVNQILLRECTQ